MILSNEQILLAILAFIFGLLSKFIFDIWDEKRKRQSLTFTKRTISSFSATQLGKELAEQTKLYFNEEIVESIQIVSIQVENTGASAVRKQAFSVHFDEMARILGTPESKSSSEDLRFVNVERVQHKMNSYRFSIDILQKGRKLAWKFVVVDNLSSEIKIEHGLAAASLSDLEEVDLDVNSVIVSSRAQLDLIGRLKVILGLLVGILALYITKDIAGILQENEAVIILNSIMVALLLVLIYVGASTIPLMFRKEISRQIGLSFNDGTTVTGDILHGDTVYKTVHYTSEEEAVQRESQDGNL